MSELSPYTGSVMKTQWGVSHLNTQTLTYVLPSFQIALIIHFNDIVGNGTASGEGTNANSQILLMLTNRSKIITTQITGGIINTFQCHFTVIKFWHPNYYIHKVVYYM